MAQKKATQKAPAQNAKAQTKATAPEITPEDCAKTVAGLGSKLKASATATRARVDHPDSNRIQMGFAKTRNGVRISCPHFDPNDKEVSAGGSYLKRTLDFSGKSKQEALEMVASLAKSTLPKAQVDKS